MVSVVNKTGPRFSVTIDVSGSWCCGTFFNTQPLFSHGIAASTEYVCFSQMSGLLILQYKSYQYKGTIHQTFTFGELLAKPKCKYYGMLGTNAEGIKSFPGQIKRYFHTMVTSETENTIQN